GGGGGQERRGVPRGGGETRPPRSRSAVVSVRASFGLSRQSRALGAGANEDRGRSVVSPAAAAAEDSYRLAALSHESRNLRKSSRVSLSVASCARAAHSAAFCRQYPIFCRMTVPPLEPAAYPSSPRQELRGRIRGMLNILSREEGFKFQRVGPAKRSVPTRESACQERRVGPARRRAFACPTPSARRREIFDADGLRGWKPKAPLRVVWSRGTSVRVRVRYEGRTHDNSGRDARRPSRARRLSRVCRPQRRTDDRQARGHSRPSRRRQGHAVAARLGAPRRRA